MKYQISWGNSPDKKSHVCKNKREAKRVLKDYQKYSNYKGDFKIVEV